MCKLLFLIGLLIFALMMNVYVEGFGRGRGVGRVGRVGRGWGGGTANWYGGGGTIYVDDPYPLRDFLI